MLRQALVITIIMILIGLGSTDSAMAHAFDHAFHHSPNPFNHEVLAFAKNMNASMKKMMNEMHHPGMTGNADVDFLAMMIPHHEGAVEMARLVLLYGKDPLVRNLAEEIIASQQVEIMAMRDRLSVLRQGENLDPDHFPALTGIRGTTYSD